MKEDAIKVLVVKPNESPLKTVISNSKDEYISLTEEQMKFYEKEVHVKEETIEKSLDQEQKDTLQVSVPSPDPFSEFSVEIASMKDESKKIKLELPVSQAVLDDTLELLTGKRDGTEYVLLEAKCPYFEISRHDEIPMLNKIAEITKSMTENEQILFENWCDHWQEGECTDLTEIANAGLQIHKIVYIEGIHTMGELGQTVIMATDMKQKIDRIGNIPNTEHTLAEYLDYEAIGRDYSSGGRGSNYPMLDGQKVRGYVLDDGEVDAKLFTKEEILETDLDELEFQSHDFIKEELDRTPSKALEQDLDSLWER